MKIYKVVFFIAGMLLLPLHNGQAQFRSDVESKFDRTGQIVRSDSQSEGSSFWGLQNFRMNHSYDMTVGSFGGNTYNLNTYTNTMHLMFNENLHGRLDLSMSHSPFGPNIMGQENHTQFYIRNAELNYNFNNNARVQLRFQQIPAGYGYGYSPSYYNRNRSYGTPYHW